MQELVLVLSSLAGAATAAAVRGRPGRRLASIGASPRIKSQIGSLAVERDILTKTIARMYGPDSGLTAVQRDRLLARYQHRLGIILAKAEKLEQAGRHPDLGPLGDGLITLMDQKLSRLDERLGEISSRIAARAPEAAKRPGRAGARPRRPEAADIPAGPAQSFEITTLTSIPGTRADPGPVADPAPKAQAVLVRKEQSVLEHAAQKEQVVPEQAVQKEQAAGAQTVLEHAEPARKEQAVLEPVRKEEPAAQAVPEPAVPDPAQADDPDDLSDAGELEEVKRQLERTLSKLQQAEVE